MGAASLENWLYPSVGNSLFETWDAEDMLILAKMWHFGDVGTLVDVGDYRKALEGIKCGVLVMPSWTDQDFTLEASEIEVKSL
jgi:homoserine acetyltransferase